MKKLSNLQIKLLDMFSSFHNYCVDHSLNYYALGGTMLGALRHEGFIPWDDDIDVGMPRKDYDILRSLLNGQNIDSRYVLETPDSLDLNFCYPYSKLYDTHTTLIENTRNAMVRGIFIDIFPLDGIGNTVEESIRNYNPIDRRIKMLNMRRTKIDKERSLLKNGVLYLLQSIPESFLSNRKLSLKIESMCKQRKFAECVYGGNLVGAWGYKEVMECSVFGNPRLYRFENIEIYGAQYAETYLSNQYGDWKKLPPIEKQVSHHDYYLDLEKGYLDE